MSVLFLDFPVTITDSTNHSLSKFMGARVTSIFLYILVSGIVGADPDMVCTPVIQNLEGRGRRGRVQDYPQVHGLKPA